MVLLCGRRSPRNQKVSLGSPSISWPDVLAGAAAFRWLAAVAAPEALPASAARPRKLREAAAA